MSAYVVDQDHIEYLIQQAERWEALRIWMNGEAVEHTAREWGQILWSENVASVEHCYSGADNLPGPTHESVYMFERTGAVWVQVNPAQVIKAIHCLEYQSCEHEGWGESEASAFLRALARCAVRELPGMDDLKWGSPKPDSRRKTVAA